MGIQSDSGTETETDVEVEADDTETSDVTTTEDDSTTVETDDAPKPKPPAKKAEAKPGDDDYVPTASEWRRTKEALSKSNADAKRNRERARELEEQTRATETDHEKALREAREEGERKFRTPLVRTAVRGALVEAGALGFLEDERDPKSDEAQKKATSRMSRLMKLVDFDGLEVDEEGSVIGIEAAVAELTRDLPDLFSVPVRKPKARPTGAPKPAAVEKPKSTAEIHAARLLGRA